MIRSALRSIPTISALLLLVLSGACAPRSKVAPLPAAPPGIPLSPAEAQEALGKVRARNAGLRNFAVSGKAALTDRGSSQHFPVSCVAQMPDRLRLVILTPFRQPAETLATDGEYLYIRSHTGRHPFHKTAAKTEALRRMLAIPLSAEELLGLLAGRPPLPSHATVRLRKIRANEEAYELTLEDGKGRVMEKMFLGPDKEVYKVETYTIKGSLAWRAEFSGAREDRGFRIPERITVSDPDTTLAVTLNRFRAGVSVAPGAFVLEP